MKYKIGWCVIIWAPVLHLFFVGECLSASITPPDLNQNTEIVGVYSITLRVLFKCPVLPPEGAFADLFAGENNASPTDNCTQLRGHNCQELDCPRQNDMCCFDACALGFICVNQAHLAHATACVLHRGGNIVYEYPAGSVFDVTSRGEKCQTCVCTPDGIAPFCRDLRECF